MWRVHGIFPPEEKIRFSGNGRIVLSGPCFQSPLLRAGSASCDRGGRTALSGPVGPVTCQELQTLQQHPDGSGKKQKPELRAGVSRTHPTRETKNKTNSTEKVERLRDNQRGLSVVIYNRL